MPETSPFGRPLNYSEPLFIFAGDRLAGAAYSQCMDTKYTAILPELEIGAAAFGVPLDEERRECGRRMLAAQYWLDAMLDDPSTPAGAFERTVNSLRSGRRPFVERNVRIPQVATAITFLANSISSLSSEARGKIVERGMEIQKLTAEQMAAASLRKYIKARKAEGKITGRLIADVMAPEADERTEKYARWVERLVTSLSLMDHVVDFQEDFDSHRTRLKPTGMRRFRLGAAAARSFLPTLLSRQGRKAAREAFWQPIKETPEYRDLQTFAMMSAS